MAFLEMYLNGEWKNLSSFGTVSSVDIQSSSSAISVTGSPITSVGIINLSFNPSAIRLDQFAVPTSNLDINNKRIINVSDPVNPQDVATKAFVQASIPTISVDGAVIGTINNQGLINTTLNSLQTISNALNNFTWIYNYQPNAAGLITTNQIIVNDNSIVNARFINRISRKSNTNNSFEYTHWIDDALTGSSSQIMQMGFVNGNTGVVSPGEIFVFFSAVKHNDNTCFVDFNVNIKIPNGTSSNHAINKGQLDSKTWTSSSITDFSTASTTAAKTISLDQFAIPAANLNLNNKNITNLATPTLSNHAADKYYVDSRRISDFNSPITDISMNTNKIINLAPPTLSTDAVNKNYVDTRSVNELVAPISAFSMNNNRITNVANPISEGDVATKNYVDAKPDPASIYYCIFSSGTSTTQCVQYNNTTVDFISGFNTKLAKNASFISFDNGGLFTVTQNGLYKIEVSGRIQDGGGTNASTGVGVYIDDTINIVECWIPADGDGRRSFMASTLPFLAPNQNIRIKINQIGSATPLRINFITLSIIKLI